MTTYELKGISEITSLHDGRFAKWIPLYSARGTKQDSQKG